MTSASSGGSSNDASQLSRDGAGASPAAAHCGRRRQVGQRLPRDLVGGFGGDFSAHADSDSTQRDEPMFAQDACSVQLQDQVVRVRADAQDDLAQDVERRAWSV